MCGSRFASMALLATLVMFTAAVEVQREPMARRESRGHGAERHGHAQEGQGEEQTEDRKNEDEFYEEDEFPDGDEDQNGAPDVEDSKESLSELIRVADRNGDGKLSLSEASVQAAHTLKVTDQAERQALDDLVSKYFKDADADHDDFLDIKELPAFIDSASRYEYDFAGKEDEDVFEDGADHEAEDLIEGDDDDEGESEEDTDEEEEPAQDHVDVESEYDADEDAEPAEDKPEEAGADEPQSLLEVGEAMNAEAHTTNEEHHHSRRRTHATWADVPEGLKLAHFDADQDGKLSLVELVDRIAQELPQDLEKHKKKSVDKEITWAFQQADRNLDDAITWKEFPRFYQLVTSKDQDLMDE